MLPRLPPGDAAPAGGDHGALGRGGALHLRQLLRAREHFRSAHEEKPHLAVAMIALCADTAEEAKLIERDMLMRWVMTAMGHNRPVPTLDEITKVARMLNRTNII